MRFAEEREFAFLEVHQRLIHVVDPDAGLLVGDQGGVIVDADAVKLDERRRPEPVQPARSSNPDRSLFVFQNGARLAVTEAVRGAEIFDFSACLARELNTRQPAEVRSKP